MFKSLVALALTTLPLVYGQDSNVTTVMAALTQAKIVPNVIPSFTPRFPLDVRFTVNNTVFPVTAGANLTIAETANIPSFAIVSNITAIIGKPYLMAIIDPDALTPQNPNMSEFRHFLAADYISNGSTNGEFVLTNQSKTATLTDFIGPGPPAGSDPHRYVVLCYLQNQTGVTPPASFNASNRANFNITNFVDTVQGNNFTLLAATFFFVGPNFTNGSVTGIPANSTNSTTGTSPSGTSPASSTSGAASGAVDIGMSMTAAVAWSIVGVLTATGALLI